MTPEAPLYIIRFTHPGHAGAVDDYASHCPGHTVRRTEWARKFSSPVDALLWLEAVGGRFAGHGTAEVVPYTPPED